MKKKLLVLLMVCFSLSAFSQSRVTRLGDSKLKIQALLDYVEDSRFEMKEVSAVGSNSYVVQYLDESEACRAMLLILENSSTVTAEYFVKSEERARCY